ncbi:apolipoprotein A1/A4/E family protein [Bacillus cereus group sp. N12]|uniref:apolipoprotein A1/A4/E family protein n=1 Tax=Bacillus cereus group sp. N12 TaxID=2794586 RepID=UPI0018F400EA|nr:apolipoprotein A1/A4/E family protein [Bacillus cereus group sp. N12]MBJ8074034.1 apolipoprotein A1/A4/E family protein [Bacillus cereus group sp. N12]
MASVIDIMIQAQDRASNTFRNTSAEARKMQAIIGGITIGASAMTPALLGGLGAIASLFGTAGVAAAGFGALAYTTIGKTVETAKQLEEAQLKANAALIAGDTKGYAKQMAFVQAIMEDLTEEEKKAVVAINQLSDAWRDMENKMAPTTLSLVANSTDFLRLTMTKLFPAFQGVGQSFSNMIGKMNEGITQGKADKFFEHMNTFAVPMFEKVMISAGNILKGLGDIMIAFTPLGMRLGDGMVSLTDKFAKWAAGLQSNSAFQNFVKQVQESTPVIMNLIGQLVLTLWDIVQALYPVSLQVLQLTADFLQWARESGALDTVLGLVSAAIKLVADNANWLIPIIAAVWVGFKAFMGISALVGIISSVVGSLKNLITFLKNSQAVLTLCRTAMLLFNAALWANPITWIVALIVGLIAAGVLLYKNWDEVVKFCKQMWAVVEKQWDDGKAKIIKAYDDMVAGAKQWWAETKQKWNQTVEDAKAKAQEMKDKVTQKYEELKREAVQKIVNLVIDAAQKWEQMKTDASNKAEEMKNKAIQKYEQMKTDAVNKLNQMVNDTKQKFNDMVRAAEDKVSSMGRAATNMMNGFKEGIANGFNDAVYKVSSGINSMVSQFTGFFRTFYNSGKGLLGSFVNGITSGFGDAVSAVSRGMSNIRAYLPFSPAKKGPLSDLDKSGEAFFPTWYNAALTQVGAMERSMGRAFGGVANQADVALAGTGLEAFTGGRSKIVVEHIHKGEVDINGEDLKASINQVSREVVNTAQIGSRFDYGGLQQSIRKL